METVFGAELQRAALDLPGDVAFWMGRALRTGVFQIQSGAYGSGLPGDVVCPIAAAAAIAGVWLDGALLPGNPRWGTPTGPSTKVEDFAAYFDLCAEEMGTEAAIRIVRDTLEFQDRIRSTSMSGVA